MPVVSLAAVFLWNAQRAFTLDTETIYGQYQVLSPCSWHPCIHYSSKPRKSSYKQQCWAISYLGTSSWRWWSWWCCDMMFQVCRTYIARLKWFWNTPTLWMVAWQMLFSHSLLSSCLDTWMHWSNCILDMNIAILHRCLLESESVLQPGGGGSCGSEVPIGSHTANCKVLPCFYSIIKD